MENIPNPQESLAEYVKRVRTGLGMSQDELASAANIHPQSIGKIERGVTTRLNRKTRDGLVKALKIPDHYLDAVNKGVALPNAIQFCPQCWNPGTEPEDIWLSPRSKFCFLCGTGLRSSCANCHQRITSLKFKFCPYCGTSYKGDVSVQGS